MFISSICLIYFYRINCIVDESIINHLIIDESGEVINNNNLIYHLLIVTSKLHVANAIPTL